MGNSFQELPAVITIMISINNVLGIVNTYHNGLTLNLKGELMMVSP